MGSHHDFVPIIEKLEKSFYCITLDLPFHGENKDFIFNNPQDAEQAILKTLQLTSLKRSTLIGYSMGGRIAQRLLKHLENSRLVLISAALLPLNSQEIIERKRSEKQIISDLLNKPFIDFLSSWYQKPLFKTLKKNSQVYQSLIKQRAHQNPQKLISALEFFSPTTYTPPPYFLENLATPLLYIAGEQDEKYKVLSASIHSLKPDAWISTISQSSHALHLEQPGTVAYLIDQFAKK